MERCIAMRALKGKGVFLNFHLPVLGSMDQLQETSVFTAVVLAAPFSPNLDVPCLEDIDKVDFDAFDADEGLFFKLVNVRPLDNIKGSYLDKLWNFKLPERCVLHMNEGVCVLSLSHHIRDGAIKCEYPLLAWHELVSEHVRGADSLADVGLAAKPKKSKKGKK
jgi:hypothetical protein